MEEKDKELINKLKAIQGQELKYSKLCEALDLPNKGTSTCSKTSQLNNLQNYCELNTLQSPTRYIVSEVYEESILAILNSNNKFQLLFDAMMYKAFLENHGEPLYLSHMDLLKLFQEVNENFSYACNHEHMARLGEEYLFMADMSQVVYKILRQWTMRRLEFMRVRKIVLFSDGFRLYVQHIGKHGIYKTIHNVSVNSDESRICQAIYNRAVEEIMPPDWGKSKKDGGFGTWVSEWRWRQFEKRIQELVKEKFNGQYVDMKSVFVLMPPSDQWLYDKLNKTYAEISNLADINIEACRKIIDTRQLDGNTNEERRKFIDTAIILKPKINIKKELEKEDED